MKVKLLGFAAGLFAVSAFGISQIQVQASEPGQVGSAPRCTVEAVGGRIKAFDVKNHTATVKFKVTGGEKCKVQVSANSFYAPSIDGKPYDKQKLYQRETRTYSPGTYNLAVALPKKSTEAKGCFYQVDLTYGTHNVTPVIAFSHGKLDCGNEPNPMAACESLTVTNAANSTTSFNFTTQASAKNGAKVSSYVYVVTKDGQTVTTKNVPSTALQNTYTYTQNTPGTYQVNVTVNTSEGAKTGPACAGTFTVRGITEVQNPAVTITKHVNGQKSDIVDVNEVFPYQLKVTNTGNVELKNTVVTDNAPEGVQFMNADMGTIANNKWSYTIPTLAINQSITVNITAKLTKEMPGGTKNTACVDTPQTPTNPDACDDATVTTPEPNKVEVCDPSTGETIVVDEKDQDKYEPKDSEVCQPADNPKAEPLPEVLPETGPIDTALQLIGATSLAGAGGYYFTTRRKG